MATPKRPQPVLAAGLPCANHQCGHRLDDHSSYGCNELILTVLDTEARCPCVAFITDPEDSWRNLRDMVSVVGLCALCDGPMQTDIGVVDGAHAECASAADPDRGKRCSRCGGDPYSCPCTTGWDSSRGMLW